MRNQLIFDFPIVEEMSFSTLITCDGNSSAVRFAKAILDGVSSEKLLYIYGSSGSGKSHILKAVASELNLKGLDSGIFSFTEAGGVSSKVLVSSLERRFSDSSALLLDDIHSAPPDPSLKQFIWQLYNDFHERNYPIIITGDSPPKELKNLDEHLVSRLLWGLAAKVDVTDDDSRRMIMKKLAADRQIIIPADVIDHFLVKLPRSIPRLVKALDAVRHLSLESKKKITLSLAKEALDGNL